MWTLQVPELKVNKKDSDFKLYVIFEVKRILLDGQIMISEWTVKML